MGERLGNIGYLAAKKEVTKGVVSGTPDAYVPLYKETITTNPNFVEQTPIAGHRFARNDVLRGQRSHGGEVTIQAEPNMTAKFFDMLLVKGASTGADPLTNPYTLDALLDPSSYTIDISTGNVVSRYWGVEASKITPDMNENEIKLVASLAGLGSFEGREIASVSGAGPYTVVLKTDYDPSPTKGLVVGDLIRFTLANGTTVDAAVATVPNGTSITCTTNPTVAAGDMLTLRPATPVYNLLDTFLWSRTEFRFGATAAAALSATHLPLEPGSSWEVMNGFNEDEGEKRSGSADPAALVRKLGDATLHVKKYFDKPDDIKLVNNIGKNACVIRHFAGANNQYELRITLNNIRTSSPLPDLESDEVQYSELDYLTTQDQTDGQAFDVKVINNAAV